MACAEASYNGGLAFCILISKPKVPREMGCVYICMVLFLQLRCMSLQPANAAELRNAADLRDAVQRYEVGQVNRLLYHGVDPDSVVRKGDQTALMVCVNSRALTRNASYNWRCDTIAEHLLLKGASPFLTDKWGQSALSLASGHQDIPMIKIMSRCTRTETPEEVKMIGMALVRARRDYPVLEGPPPRAPQWGYGAR